MSEREQPGPASSLSDDDEETHGENVYGDYEAEEDNAGEEEYSAQDQRVAAANCSRPPSPVPSWRQPSEDVVVAEGADDDAFVLGTESQAWKDKMYYDRDCSNNISRSLRVVPIEDVQVQFPS